MPKSIALVLNCSPECVDAALKYPGLFFEFSNGPRHFLESRKRSQTFRQYGSLAVKCANALEESRIVMGEFAL